MGEDNGLQVRWTIGDGGEQYLADVAGRLNAAGYRVAKVFTEGAEVFDCPDHVIRVDLGGPTADLIWDTLDWKIIVYPFKVSTPSDELSQVLSDREDERPGEVARLAGRVLDEARRRWGTPEPVTVGPSPHQKALVEYLRVRMQHVAVGRLVPVDIDAKGLSFAQVKAMAEQRAGRPLRPENDLGHGFVCKSCGAPSPVGIGYVADGAAAAAASMAVTVCGCGYSGGA